MNRWSLKVKVAAYATGLTMVALAVAAIVLLPFVKTRQVAELDSQLTNAVEELFRDLKNFRGAPPSPRHPLEAKYVPLALRDRYLILRGPEGQILYTSPKLGGIKLGGSEAGMRTVEILGEDCRVGTFRAGNFTADVGTPMGDIAAFQDALRTGLWVALAAAGAVVFAGAILLGAKAIAPVTALTAAAEKISATNLAERLPMPGSRDEIARLTEVLNSTFDRLQNSYEVATRFSADASHQLKTPVAVLRAGLEELRAGHGIGPGEREEVDALLQQTRRLTALIEDLLLLAQADAGRLAIEAERFDLVALVAGALDDLQTLAGDSLRIEQELPASLSVKGDRRRVALILQNLAENAAKYSPAGGSVRVHVEQESGWALVTVANTGAGIPAEEQSRIFERFRRGKSIGENVRGQGLGLNIARELARAHGGELRLVRSDPDWTEFELKLHADSESGQA